MCIGNRKVEPHSNARVPNAYRIGLDQQEPDFAPVAFFRLPYDVKMSADGFQDSKSSNQLRLGTLGENVAAMIDYMLRRSRERFDAMEKEARLLIPGLQSINISTPKAQIRQLNLVMEDGFEMPAGYASACLLYTSPRPRDRTRSRMPSSA